MFALWSSSFSAGRCRCRLDRGLWGLIADFVLRLLLSVGSARFVGLVFVGAAGGGGVYLRKRTVFLPATIMMETHSGMSFLRARISGRL